MLGFKRRAEINRLALIKQEHAELNTKAVAMTERIANQNKVSDGQLSFRDYCTKWPLNYDDLMRIGRIDADASLRRYRQSKRYA